MSGSKRREGAGPGGSRTVEYRIGDENPSTAAAMALAEAEGLDPTEMRTLGNHIDLDALNGVLSSDSTSPSVVFTVWEYRVEVTDEKVIVDG